jgi:predicted chitinase
MAVETLEGQTKTISASKLMGRDVGGSSLGKVGGGPYGGTSATGKLAGIVRGNKQAIAINAEKITRLKKIADLQSKRISGDDIGSKLPTEETAILDSLDNILEALRKEQAAKDKLDADDRKRKENKKRKMKESGLEKSLKAVKKQGEKMLAPVTNMFDKLIQGLMALVAGKIVISLFDWFQDPENNKKVQTVFRFLSDFWPAIVGGLLLFMPMIFGPAGFVIMLGALIIGFLPKLISATKQLFGFGKQTEKDADAANKDLKDVESETGKLDGAETADAVSSDDIKPIEEKGEQLKKAPEPGSGQAPAKPVAMQGGGVVPGSGPNKDTIPAMLAPGEFVMSRGAVQEYGADTLAGMNAMGGGTNRPMITNNVMYASGGGEVPDKEEPGGRNKTKNKRGSGAKNRTEGGGTQFFAGLGKGISDFFSGVQEGMEGAADTKEKKEETSSGGGGGFNESSLKAAMDKAGYTDQTERAMFLAQMAHESGNFRYDEEIHDGSNYEGRSDLGNTQPGDGKRYKGRGYIQLTGRANYRHYGNKLGFDLEGQPELAKRPDVAAAVAVGYWNERVNREAARKGDVRTVTRNINGGYNGLADREAKFKKYMGDPNYTAPGSGLVASSVSPSSSSSSASSVSSSPSTSSSTNILQMIRKEAGGSSAPTMTASKPKPVVGQPVKRGGTSVQAVAQAQEAQQTAMEGSTSSGGGSDVPSFSATAFRSGHKIKTLGIVA